MLIKVYASRSQTRSMGLHDPIGDPHGGVAYGERNDPVTAAVVVGGGLIGGMMQGNAAQRAAQTQADANARAQDQLMATGQQASQQFAPYTQLGQSGVNALSANMPYFQHQFNNQDLNAQLAPNYAFQLEQGQGATNAANNATGGMVGGNALKGLQDYTQNYAQGAYQNAFNNYTANQTNIFNRLNGIANLGFQGATGTANAQLGVGTNIAQLTQGIGQAQAAGQVGQANAYAGAANNLGNYAYLYGAGQGGGTGLSAPGGFNQSGVQTINGMANPNFVGPVP